MQHNKDISIYLAKVKRNLSPPPPPSFQHFTVDTWHDNDIFSTAKVKQGLYNRTATSPTTAFFLLMSNLKSYLCHLYIICARYHHKNVFLIAMSIILLFNKEIDLKQISSLWKERAESLK